MDVRASTTSAVTVAEANAATVIPLEKMPPVELKVTVEVGGALAGILRADLPANQESAVLGLVERIADQMAQLAGG